MGHVQVANTKKGGCEGRVKYPQTLHELSCQSTQSIACGDKCMNHASLIMHVQYDLGMAHVSF